MQKNRQKDDLIRIREKNTKNTVLVGFETMIS